MKSDEIAPIQPQQWNRLRLSDEFTYRLRNLKARTNLTPNLLCRVGFMLSLTEPQIPNPERYPENGLEFSRSTLLGEHDELFHAMLRQRLANDGLDINHHFTQQFRAHMNRGAELACNRVRDLGDIVDLIPSAGRSSPNGESAKEQ